MEITTFIERFKEQFELLDWGEEILKETEFQKKSLGFIDCINGVRNDRRRI